LAKAKPFEASQLIDQVIAPRRLGQVVGGWKLPQFAPPVRQSRAALTTDGSTWPLPAAWVLAGRPRPT
jgi:hypothetical protein